MFPVLYRSNTLDFKYNGLGFIKNCTKCIVTEVRNGLYELEADVLTNDRLAQQIGVGMFLKVKANSYDDLQLFEIYSLSITEYVITIKAQHIRYIFGGNVLSDLLINNPMTPQQIWNTIQSQSLLELPNSFTFYSDVTTESTMSLGSDPIRLGDFFSGTKGSVLDIFGGEFHYDNFKVELLKNRGTQTGIALRYGSNISTYQQDSDSSTVYSHILPIAYVKGEGENHEDAGEYRIYHDLIHLDDEILTYKRALVYDFSDDFSNDVLEISNGVPTSESWNSLVSKLALTAQKYITRNKSQLIEPTVNITVDVAETLKNLDKCKLCDSILVYFTPFEFKTTAKIVKTEYDVLLEKYNKIELGTIKKSIADLFSGKNIGGV